MSALRGRILIINPFSARQLVTIRPVRRWLHRTIVCVNTSGALQEELLLLVLHIERLIASWDESCQPLILGPFFFEVWLGLTSPGSFLVVF